jgi:pimeloyl-ACP methyl ester carboxylesterase
MAGESLIVGVEVDGRCWFSQLIDTSGTPREQARRLLSLLFPSVLADSIYDQYGDIVAAARAQLSPDLVQRQAAAMDAWHRNGAGPRLQKLHAPTLGAAGTEDIVIPASNALRLVNAIPGTWLAQFKGWRPRLYGAARTPAGGSHQWISRPLKSTVVSLPSLRTIHEAYRVHAFQRLRIGFA